MSSGVATALIATARVDDEIWGSLEDPQTSILREGGAASLGWWCRDSVQITLPLAEGVGRCPTIEVFDGAGRQLIDDTMCLGQGTPISRTYPGLDVEVAPAWEPPAENSDRSRGCALGARPPLGHGFRWLLLLSLGVAWLLRSKRGK